MNAPPLEVEELLLGAVHMRDSHVRRFLDAVLSTPPPSDAGPRWMEFMIRRFADLYYRVPFIDDINIVGPSVVAQQAHDQSVYSAFIARYPLSLVTSRRMINTDQLGMNCDDTRLIVEMTMFEMTKQFIDVHLRRVDDHTHHGLNAKTVGVTLIEVAKQVFNIEIDTSIPIEWVLHDLCDGLDGTIFYQVQAALIKMQVMRNRCDAGIDVEQYPLSAHMTLDRCYELAHRWNTYVNQVKGWRRNAIVPLLAFERDYASMFHPVSLPPAAISMNVIQFHSTHEHLNIIVTPPSHSGGIGIGWQSKKRRDARSRRLRAEAASSSSSSSNGTTIREETKIARRPMLLVELQATRDRMLSSIDECDAMIRRMTFDAVDKAH